MLTISNSVLCPPVHRLQPQSAYHFCWATGHHGKYKKLSKTAKGAYKSDANHGSLYLTLDFISIVLLRGNVRRNIRSDKPKSKDTVRTRRSSRGEWRSFHYSSWNTGNPPQRTVLSEAFQQLNRIEAMLGGGGYTPNTSNILDGGGGGIVLFTSLECFGGKF